MYTVNQGLSITSASKNGKLDWEEFFLVKVIRTTRLYRF